MDQGNLEQLAERLLARLYLSPGRPAQVRLFPGRLPPSLPFATPVPPGARLIGSVGGSVDGQTVRADLIYDLDGDADDALTFYHQTSAEQGWPAVPSGSPRGGFMPRHMPSMETFCRGERGPWYSIALAALGAGTEQRIHLETADPGPCAPRRGAPQAHFEALPALYPPEGVALHMLGGSGSFDRWSSEAVAETDQDVAVLEAHFARQLAAVGWARLAGGTGGPAAWSTWASRDAPSKQALLLVTERPAGGRNLFLRVETAAPVGGYSVSSTSMRTFHYP